MTPHDIDELPGNGVWKDRSKPPVVRVLGVPVTFAERAEVLSVVEHARNAGERTYIVVTNPHSILTCRRDHEMLSATNGAGLVLPDGVGTSLAARLITGRSAGPRTPGPELMLYLLDRGRSIGLRHYLYGAQPEVLEELARRLRVLFPGVLITGAYSPPFYPLTDAEDELIVENISRTKPDVVWVGLGAPKQEKWMANHVGRVSAAVMIGVGAAFDYHAGAVPRAPRWARKVGLEWFYRLMHEPRRLWKRNLDSPLFVALVCAQKAGLVRL
jgi:N-acetylglucosaminyldiphosphoundecaprenol N-acetyl-beta-D-mannosaminyltransferase